MKFICYLEDAAGLEYKVIVDVSIEPAQDGGSTDPSWEASWSVESVHNTAGINITDKISVDDALSIDNQITQYFEDEKQEMM